MYHELAHANDFFPPDMWSSISQDTTPLKYFRDNGTSSDILSATYPLRSSEMHELAQVRFRDTTPTSTQRDYRGTDIETFFTPDIAADFYSYLTAPEDFATLVGHYMMLYRLDAEADVAIIDGRTSNDEPLVVWGQRNRIREDSLEDRIVYAVSRVYPELNDIRGTLRSLPDPFMMTPNQGWFENLDISPQTLNPFSQNSLNRWLGQKDIERNKLTPSQLKVLEKENTRDIHQGRLQTEFEN